MARRWAITLCALAAGMLASCAHALGAAAWFGYGNESDRDQPGHWIAALRQGGIGLPDRVYYLDPSMPWLEEYRGHVAALSGLLGIEVDSGAVLAVETALARAM